MGHSFLGSEVCECPQLSHHLQEAGPSQLTSLLPVPPLVALLGLVRFSLQSAHSKDELLETSEPMGML